MCGIVYTWRKDGKPARKRIAKRYFKQRDRGEDGFGYVSLDETGIVLEHKRTQDEDEILEALTQSQSQHVLFHHRFPTSTANVPEAAHPILVKHQELKHSYYVVHNGVISNSRALKIEHDKLGYKYTTALQSQFKTASGKLYYGDMAFNDSESLAIELARTIEGLQPEVGTTGSAAVIILQANKAGTKVKAIYYGTNGLNPLTLTDDDTGLTIASEGGTPLQAHIMFRLDVKTKALTVVNVPFKKPAPVTTTYYPYGTHSYQFTKGDFKDDERVYPDAEEDDYVPEPYGETLEELNQALEAVEADMQIATQAGESEELEDLEIEREGIMWQIQQLAEADAPQSRIGF